MGGEIKGNDKTAQSSSLRRITCPLFVDLSSRNTQLAHLSPCNVAAEAPADAIAHLEQTRTEDVHVY